MCSIRPASQGPSSSVSVAASAWNCADQAGSYWNDVDRHNSILTGLRAR